MTVRSILLAAGGLLAFAAGSAGVQAHHAFSAEFSRDLPIEVQGTVTKVEWMNPHARFYVDAEDENGEIVNWNFELGSPNNLMRRGWTRNSLKPGDVVSVTGHRARNAPHVGNASSVVLGDGRKVFAGSSIENERQ